MKLVEIIEDEAFDPKDFINGMPQISESVDTKDFIMGDWPVRALLQRGFQQDPKNDLWYEKKLANGIPIGVQAGGTPDKGAYDERSYINVLYQHDGQGYEFWVGLAPHGRVGEAVDAVERILTPVMPSQWSSLHPDAQKKRSEIYKALEALTNGGVFVGEAQEPAAGDRTDPNGFIMGAGPLIQFKTRFQELGWLYRGIVVTPTVHGTNIDVHTFELTYAPDRFMSSNATWPDSIKYTAHVVEFSEGGQQLISVCADGVKSLYAGDDPHGDEVYDEVDWSTNEQLQPDDMTGVEFAELVDNLIRSDTGPNEIEDQGPSSREPED